MEKNKLSNEDIVTIALYTLSGGTRSFDLEGIAKKADELAKVRFRWMHKSKNLIKVNQEFVAKIKKFTIILKFV